MQRPGRCISPDVAAILRRARDIGESSWRAGIALRLDPAALERIDRGLDQLGVSASYLTPKTTPSAGAAEPASGRGRSAPPSHRLDADYSQRGGTGDEQKHLAP